MVFDKKEYDKQYHQNNKEKINEKSRIWRENNKQHIKEYRENNKEQQKEYNQTPVGKKSMAISDWKRRGLKLYGYTHDELYDYYLEINHCEVCNKDLSTTKKCMDHCHTDGCFRWVLCCSCNGHDNWMTKI